jgi:lysozyme
MIEAENPIIKTDETSGEKEFSLKEKEVDAKIKYDQKGLWVTSPLLLGVITAISGLIGTGIGAVLQGNANLKLERNKFEFIQIQKALETTDTKEAAKRLVFLVDIGVIQSLDGNKIRKIAETQPQKIPTFGSSLEMVSQFEGTYLKPTKDPLGVQIIGSGHALTPEEIKTGIILIDGKPVSFWNGITEEQAQKLLNQDLEPSRKAIDKLVKVKLTENQREALASFTYNLGINTFAGSKLLKVLNEGKYEEVPNELRKWDKVGGTTLPGLKRRRDAEIELWNRN